MFKEILILLLLSLLYEVKAGKAMRKHSRKEESSLGNEDSSQTGSKSRPSKIIQGMKDKSVKLKEEGTEYNSNTNKEANDLDESEMKSQFSSSNLVKHMKASTDEEEKIEGQKGNGENVQRLNYNGTPVDIDPNMNPSSFDYTELEQKQKEKINSESSLNDNGMSGQLGGNDKLKGKTGIEGELTNEETSPGKSSKKLPGEKGKVDSLGSEEGTSPGSLLDIAQGMDSKLKNLPEMKTVAAVESGKAVTEEELNKSISTITQILGILSSEKKKYAASLSKLSQKLETTESKKKRKGARKVLFPKRSPREKKFPSKSVINYHI